MVVMVATAGQFDIGVDIGGTFTDIVCRRAGEPMRTLKIPTTRGDPSEAVLKRHDPSHAGLGVVADDIARFLHGTTIATNAVLERKGAKIGLITSEGFRDILEIGYQLRQELLPTSCWNRSRRCSWRPARSARRRASRSRRRAR